MYDTTYCYSPKSVVLLATVVVTVVKAQNRRNYAKSVGVGISDGEIEKIKFLREMCKEESRDANLYAFGVVSTI